MHSPCWAAGGGIRSPQDRRSASPPQSCHAQRAATGHLDRVSHDNLAFLPIAPASPSLSDDRRRECNEGDSYPIRRQARHHTPQSRRIRLASSCPVPIPILTLPHLASGVAMRCKRAHKPAQGVVARRLISC
ncbi:hypothetical protein LY78DRAFT_257868 [Colletotrichum sublineola]|nr:hypothetical protein LY78DRAFT_257868 [Colletotrichum sublineola]